VEANERKEQAVKFLVWKKIVRKREKIKSDQCKKRKVGKGKGPRTVTIGRAKEGGKPKRLNPNSGRWGGGGFHPSKNAVERFERNQLSTRGGDSGKGGGDYVILRP